VICEGFMERKESLIDPEGYTELEKSQEEKREHLKPQTNG
jgi:hypothetical protein